MKLCFFTYDKPNYHAGPVVNLRRILPRLRQRGVDVSCLVIHRGSHSPCAGYLREQGVDCRVLRWQNVTRRHIRWIFEQLASIQPEVFIPNVSVPACYAARWARESGMVTVAACRSDTAFHWQLMDQFVLGEEAWRVSGLICVSTELQDRVRARGKTTTPIAVIPSGVPIPPHPVSSHRPLQIVYVGRIQEEQKQITAVLRTMLDVLARLPDATATIIGSGASLAACRQMANQSESADRVRFLNGVAPEQISQTLGTASVALLLSDYEGTPGALMDAMAAGLVPVTRRTPGGVLELVKDNHTGVIVDTTLKDPVGIQSATTALVQLANDYERWNRLSQNARDHVVLNYSVDSCVDRWIAFSQELARKQTQPRRTFHPPRRISLPPVWHSFVREDVRWWNIYRRSKGLLGRALGLS